MGISFKDAKINNYQYDWWNLIDNHPVYGSKLKSIIKRNLDLIKNLINEDEIINIQIVNSMPAHIATLTFRMLVGVEKILILHLDKLMEFPS